MLWSDGVFKQNCWPMYDCRTSTPTRSSPPSTSPLFPQRCPPASHQRPAFPHSTLHLSRPPPCLDANGLIPAAPPQPDEYEKLGSYALIGLPDDQYPTRYVDVDSMKTDYPIVIGGQNFGCGSSREHAPVAMGASGTTVVVAESYARIFFRNCVST